ncbi:hypothetical protein HVA01_09000 [Halovibrio variabilis]|uniref:Uncharacterized protein n=1 Tax=Halovibrio variabilis TaxID=31910 RepID=A0A511UKX1_9GAMM|nr:hypothetical protein [Halovibrio variabilis]GEN27254.1 hypothetical protein HVA01_09000 [Halovibrio variabilis]
MAAWNNRLVGLYKERDGTIDSWTVDNRVVGTWCTERTENTLLLGADDLLTREIDKEQTGLYAQNQLRIDERWVLLGGVRCGQHR